MRMAGAYVSTAEYAAHIFDELRCGFLIMGDLAPTMAPKAAFSNARPVNASGLWLCWPPGR